jgi:hypothetical protein
VADPRTPGPTHGPAPEDVQAQLRALLDLAAPALTVAWQCALTRELGEAGVAVVFVDVAKGPRFLDTPARVEVILRGDSYLIAVLPRADAIAAAATACDHCGAGLEACYVYADHGGALVVHVDVDGLGALSSVLVPGGIH